MSARGFTVLVVGDVLESGSPDEWVFQMALTERAILITRDRGLANSTQFGIERTLGVIWIHQGDLTAAAEIELVERFFDTHGTEDIRGKLAILYRNETQIQ